MARQPRLFDAPPEDRTSATLQVSESNRSAWAMLRRWTAWPGGALALAGPAGSGKSHMARAWAEIAGAALWDGEGRALEAFEAAGRRLVIDNANRFADEAHLALLLDAARAGGGAILLVAQEPPQSWPMALKDLRSRLAAIPVETLHDPDDELLAGVLARLCKARFIKLSDKAATYLTLHMERSFAAAHAVADAIDREHVRGSRPIPVAVAVRALRSMGMNAPDPDDEAGEGSPEGT
ncbi:MAG: chromosomal replication initiator DnaA [Hyphomonadaceae bacterium]|nr:MAG: ATP/GTP-binding protein [Caulobacteraceae bacterium]MBT9445147.1 chromosomal replication initiator DnaA [Hyphomonadaceae bacterium]